MKPNHLRYKATKKMVRLTGKRLFESCYWCDIKIVWHQKIPEHRLTKRYKGGGNITFFHNGRWITMPIVTIDHHTELRNGGSNEIENLLFTCSKCNNKRDQIIKPLSIVCKDCGGEKSASKKRFCDECNRKGFERAMQAEAREVLLTNDLTFIEALEFLDQ